MLGILNMMHTRFVQHFKQRPRLRIRHRNQIRGDFCRICHHSRQIFRQFVANTRMQPEETQQP
ncbi:hypothetical protein D3C83_167080 [compost metagenome]